MMEVIIKKISAVETINVRAPVLRTGQPKETAKFDIDENITTYHFGGFYNKKIIATATIYPENRAKHLKEWRLRGMAVLPAFRSNGIGELILIKCCEFIKSENGRTIWCNARIKAVKFYKKCELEICSDKFDIANIGPHYQMQKLIK